MDWQLRGAQIGDAMGLAELSLIAGHGFLNVLYQDVFQDRRLEDIVCERRILNPRSIGHLRHWVVAAGSDSEISGAINFYTPDALEEIHPDDAVPDDRKIILPPFRQLDPLTDNSLHINMLAVFPQHRGRGIAESLIAHTVGVARAAALPAVTLLTYEEDKKLVDYYRRLGFAVTGRSAVVPHPYFLHGGDIVAMSLPVA